MLGVSRRRRAGPDRFVYAKTAAFFLGAGLFFGGVATGRDWAVLAAVGVLLVGLALRFADRDRGDAEEDGGAGEDGAERPD
ncbi:MAG: hypothetical protein AB1941_02685 [Gemmatimonadota bacterium]